MRKLINVLKQKSIKTETIAIFFKQLSILYEAGIPVHQCLKLLLSLEINNAFKDKLIIIYEDLLIGKSLSETLKKFPLIFTQIICDLMFLGQKTGKLNLTLHRIAELLDHQNRTREKIKTTLFYPIFLFIFSICISIFLLLYIVPKFSALFTETNTELPVITKYLFLFSAFLSQNIFILSLCLIIFIIITYFLFNYYLKATFIMTIYRIPIIKDYFHKLSLLQFTHNLLTTYTAGLAIDQAIILSAKSIHYPNFDIIAIEMSDMLKSGRSIYYAAHCFDFFPITFCEMIKIGEQSGKLDLMLKQAMKLIEHDINRFSTCIRESLEPLIMISLGVVIGGMLICLYLPIFNLGQTL